MDGLGQFVDLLLATDADALTVSLNDISDIEVHLFGLQLEIATEILINLLHHTSPLRVAGIGLALMHQDTLDDTVLLSLLGQRDQTLVGVVVVSGQHALHPTRSLLVHVIGDAVGEEALDIDTTDSHVDNTDLDVLGQRSHKGTTEPVGWGQTRVRTAKGSRSLTPLTHLTLWATVGSREIDSGHQQEARTWAGQIGCLRTGITLHVRLSETKENVKVRVSGLSDFLSLGLFGSSLLFLGCQRARQGQQKGRKEHSFKS